MKGYAAITLLALLVAGCNDSSAPATDGRTRLDAHAFLKSAYERDKAMREGRWEEYAGNDCTSIITRIDRLPDRKNAVITTKQSVDWKLVSEVSVFEPSQYGVGIRIIGLIVIEASHNGLPGEKMIDRSAEYLYYWRSSEDAQRVARAMSFLRTSCDVSRKSGF